MEVKKVREKEDSTIYRPVRNITKGKVNIVDNSIFFGVQDTKYLVTMLKGEWHEPRKGTEEHSKLFHQLILVESENRLKIFFPYLSDKELQSLSVLYNKMLYLPVYITNHIMERSDNLGGFCDIQITEKPEYGVIVEVDLNSIDNSHMSSMAHLDKRYGEKVDKKEVEIKHVGQVVKPLLPNIRYDSQRTGKEEKKYIDKLANILGGLYSSSESSGYSIVIQSTLFGKYFDPAVVDLCVWSGKSLIIVAEVSSKGRIEKDFLRFQQAREIYGDVILIAVVPDNLRNKMKKYNKLLNNEVIILTHRDVNDISKDPSLLLRRLKT